MAIILVVDDEDLVRATICQMLESADHDVFEAANGNEALRAVECHKVDLVITDIFMPGKEGIETISEFRERKPDLKIIAISGGGQTRNMDSLELAKTLGATSVIAKPFRREQILSVVKTTLEPAD